MDPTYVHFDHTADIGIRVRASTLPQLVAPAGEGLYAVIGRLVGGDRAGSFPFDLAGEDAAVLLRDYLTELLFLLERDRRVVASVEVLTFTDQRLSGVAETRLLDDKRSTYYREVKAVTYHKLAIRTIPGGCEATIIVDI